ncbi:hypothetical protein D3C72_425540 [compost metagenome]
MTAKDQLKKLIDELPEAIAGEVLDFAEFLSAKQARLAAGSAPAPEPDDEDKAWLDADLSRLGDLEPYDWGEDAPLDGEPVRWDSQTGAFLVERRS